MTAIKQAQLEPIATPRALRALAGVASVAALLFWAGASSAIATAHGTAQTVGRDAVPSIVAAEEIRTSLAAANAHALRAAMAPEDRAREAWARYENDLAVASDRLVTAAQNITYGQEERRPIVAMVTKTQAYAAIVGEARARGGDAGRERLRDATRLLREEILPAAESLDQANFRHLDAEYAEGVGASSAGAVLLGLVLLGALGSLQLFLAVRFRRFVNAWIAAATLVVLGTLVHLLVALSAARVHVRTAKADAFDSVHVLWKARAALYDAQSDETLGVFSRAVADESAFVQRLAKLSDGPVGEGDCARVATCRRVGLHGYLGDAANNITFPGEREAVVATLRAFHDYTECHAALRADVLAGDRDGVVALCFAPAAPARDTFERLDTEIDRLRELNAREFDRSVAQAFDALAGLQGHVAFVSLAAIGLVALGVRPRLAEYAA
jgi:hypothetical protein